RTLDSTYQAIAGTRYASTVYADSPLYYYRLGDTNYTNDVYLDGFDGNTSANFTSTTNDGGTAGTWTWDTTNSQLTVTGGAEPTLVYTGASVQDGFVEAVMDQAGNGGGFVGRRVDRSEEQTSELQSPDQLVCRLLR